MKSCEQILSRKRTNPICNFKIVELIIDIIVYSTVNNRQLNTLSWALCIKIKTLSLRGRQLISVSFGCKLRDTAPALYLYSVRIVLLLLVFSS